jgi:hypothetical protein
MSRRLLNLRRHRERRRLGIAVFRLPLDAVNVEEMLIREELLSPLVDHTHGAVEKALAEFVTKLSEIGFNAPDEDAV